MAVDNEELRILAEWSQRLTQELQIRDLDVDVELLLDLARKSAESVIHATAPVTTFLVGYAAGYGAGAAGAGNKASTQGAVSESADVAFRLCQEARNEGPPPRQRG